MPLRSIWHLESILLLNRTLWVEEARLSAIRSSVYSSGFSQSWSGRWDGSTLNSTNHLWIPALTERPEREPPTSKSDRLKVGNCYLEWLLFVFLVTVDGYLLFFSRALYLPKFELSVAYASSVENVSMQAVPGSYLVSAYIDNRPDSVSMCFDS